MADDSDQEKTEEPTARKRQEAVDEGRIPRSAELGTAALFLTAALTVNALGPSLSARVIELFAGGLRRLGDSADVSAGSSIALLEQTGRGLLMIVALIGAGFALTSVAVGAAQGRGVLTAKPLEPKWERLNPVANAGRMLGIQPLVDLVKSLLKVGIVGFAVWKSLGAAWPDLAELAGRDPMSLLDVMRRYSVKLLLTAGLCFLVLAAADYFYQLWQYQKNLRMSKQEVKQESRSTDGDPMLKGRMRSVARARLRRQMFRDVAKADVVIVNPTHIAIALKYDPLKAPAPFVLAMGQRKVAERIKALAFEHQIPVIENKPLARALLAAAQVGMMIPAELYAAVAEVLAFVIRQRVRRGEKPDWQRMTS